MIYTNLKYILINFEIVIPILKGDVEELDHYSTNVCNNMQGLIIDISNLPLRSLFFSAPKDIWI